MKPNKGAAGPIAFSAVCLLALLVFYALSSGPVVGLHWRGYLPAEVLTIYAPLQWAAKSCEPLYEFLTWYKNLFRPDEAPESLPNF